MSEKNDGGPAFPVSDLSWNNGMFLWDWYVGRIVQGFLSNPTTEILYLPKVMTHLEEIIRVSFGMADQILEERNKRHEEEKEDAVQRTDQA